MLYRTGCMETYAGTLRIGEGKTKSSDNKIRTMVS
jgi:hypothetical protein